jgi:hypothetical protein
MVVGSRPGFVNIPTVVSIQAFGLPPVNHRTLLGFGLSRILNKIYTSFSLQDNLCRSEKEAFQLEFQLNHSVCSSYEFVPVPLNFRIE